MSDDGAALLHQLRSERGSIEQLYEAREYAKALRETMLLADRVNEYVDANKPWELAKQTGRRHACTTCARSASKAFRILTCYLKPVLPALATQVEAFLKIEPLSFANISQPLAAGHRDRQLPAPDAARGHQAT